MFHGRPSYKQSKAARLLGVHQDGRVVKALDLSSNGRVSAWVRTPLLVDAHFTKFLVEKSGFYCTIINE